MSVSETHAYNHVAGTMKFFNLVGGSYFFVCITLFHIISSYWFVCDDWICLEIATDHEGPNPPLCVYTSYNTKSDLIEG